MKTILFACVHNAVRSQMAAAFFNVLANPQKARAISAGTDPAERVYHEVVAVNGSTLAFASWMFIWVSAFCIRWMQVLTACT